jgi:hypothetical protein
MLRISLSGPPNRRIQPERYAQFVLDIFWKIYENKYTMKNMVILIVLWNIIHSLFALDKIRNYNEQISFIFNLSNKFTVNEIGVIKYPQDEYKLYKISYGVKNDNAKNYLIISGIHGNEEAPVYAIKEFIQYLDTIELIDNISIDFIYILNPFGFEYNIRYNGQEIDLNRDFIELKSQEINSLIKGIKNINYIGVYDFHEHGSTTGFLLYYYSSKNKKLSQNILTMVKDYNIPLENKYVDVVLRSKEGAIFVPLYAKIYFMYIKKQATTGLYFDKINVEEVFVFETPKIWEIIKRKEIVELLLKYIISIKARTNCA